MPMPRQPQSGLAISSMCCSIGGVLFWPLWPIAAIVGVVLGFRARRTISESGGWQQGAGMALAGIIIGFCVIGIALIIAVAITVAALTSHN